MYVQRISWVGVFPPFRSIEKSGIFNKGGETKLHRISKETEEAESSALLESNKWLIMIFARNISY